MNIKPIKSEADYRMALKDIEGLMAATRDTPEGDRLDVLTTLVEAYEREHYAMALPDPVDAIRFRMEQRGLKAKDLQPIFGRLNRVYEVLTHKRPLTMTMVRKLNSHLGIPAEVLIRTPIKATRPEKQARPHLTIKGKKRALRKAA